MSCSAAGVTPGDSAHSLELRGQEVEQVEVNRTLSFSVRSEHSFPFCGTNRILLFLLLQLEQSCSTSRGHLKSIFAFIHIKDRVSMSLDIHNCFKSLELLKGLVSAFVSQLSGTGYVTIQVHYSLSLNYLTRPSAL